jgi:tetratricopeptide (TPR) repeat protein
VAVDYLLEPYRVGIDSVRVLGRLVNMQFVRGEAGRYYLHQVDRDYALSRVSQGEPEDRTTEPPPFTRYALRHRAAEYFKETRKPREAWKTLDDLAPQLAEFEVRIAGEEYDAAASVLLEIDFDYLLLWGHARLVAELHERLEGRLTDRELMPSSRIGLGTCYSSLGDYRRAIDHYEKSLAIAREIGDRQGEGTALGNLGTCYSSLGDYRRAIDHYEKSLAIAREIGDRQGEGYALGNLGNCYYSLGDYPRAIDHYQQSLAIAREIGDRQGEGYALTGLGDIYRDTGGLVRACEYFQEAGKIADATGNRQNQHEAHFGLALTHLYAGDLGAAREAIDRARQYDYPENTAAAWTTTGIIQLRQGGPVAASKAFACGLAEADGLLERCGQNFSALDIKGLALCGLALCEDEGHLPAAEGTFRAARKITQAKGVVARVLSQFDALALPDTDGILSPARKAAEGQ